MQMEIEETALKKEEDRLSKERLEALQKELAEEKAEFNNRKAQWDNEKASVEKLSKLREEYRFHQCPDSDCPREKVIWKRQQS